MTTGVTTRSRSRGKAPKPTKPTAVAEPRMPFMVWLSRRSWLLVTALSGLLAGLGVFSAIQAERSAGAAAGWYLAAAIAAAVATVTLESTYSQAQQRVTRDLRDELLDEQVHARVTVGNVLTGLLTLVGEIASERSQPKRRQLQAALAQKVVDAAAELVGCDNVRATFYRAEGTAPDGRIAQLTFVAAAGERGHPARRYFRRGDHNRGDAVLGLVEQGDYDFIADVQVRVDAKLWAGKDYRTLACVSVLAGDTPYGMLAIDAPGPDDLHDEECLATLRALARLLGAGLAVR